MSMMIFCLPGNELLADQLAQAIGATHGELSMRQFPDGESYIRVVSEVKGMEAIVVCTLHRPDGKLLPLLYLCRVLKDLGAVSVRSRLLSYMRQDTVFKPGEAVTSVYFMNFVLLTDGLITMMHLHRRSSCGDAAYRYRAACRPISFGMDRGEREGSVLIGPDNESEQWVWGGAGRGAPFTVLDKTRLGVPMSA